MTPEQILALAREAGILHAHDSEGHWDGLTDEEVVDSLPRFRQELEYADKRIVEILAPFAALVAEHMRYDGIHSCHSECQRPACVAMREAVQAERKACAELADSMDPLQDRAIGNAIRSRT